MSIGHLPSALLIANRDAIVLNDVMAVGMSTFMSGIARRVGGYQPYESAKLPQWPSIYESGTLRSICEINTHRKERRTSMPSLVNEPLESRKRKREGGRPANSSKNSGRVTQEGAPEDGQEAQILLLEQQILESRRHYNSIVTLLAYARDHSLKTNTLAAVSLYRIFCRLMATGSLIKSRNSTDEEGVITQWLHGKYQEYQDVLLGLLADDDTIKQSMALTLLMYLVKEQDAHLKLGGNATWKNGLFTKILKVLLEAKSAGEARVQFVEQYVKEYDDVRYYTFYTLGYV